MHHSNMTNIAGHRNKSNEKHYPSDAPSEIVVDDSSIPVQAKLAHPVVMMAGSGPKSAQKEKVTQCRQTAMYQGQGAHMICGIG